MAGKKRQANQDPPRGLIEGGRGEGSDRERHQATDQEQTSDGSESLNPLIYDSSITQRTDARKGGRTNATTTD